MQIFEELESEVRSYCRDWPTVFETSQGATLRDHEGCVFLDFFSGAGALNYGHNNPHLIDALVDYLRHDGVLHSLDMHTTAKARFLERFRDVILKPRDLDYRVQFTGPTGTNSVEAALKLARKVTGREQVISFTNAFHGMTLGALAVTGNSMKRGGAGVPLSHSTVMPYCGYLDEGSSLAYLDAVLSDRGSGFDPPAAVIVETVQGEGGLRMASVTWLRGLAELCRRHGMLLIVDDVQMGCGRTGSFFSFEQAGITPDIVCLAKSLSGTGLPMAVTLLKPELDIWKPGEHNGTFRGNNAAFVTATAALDFWIDDSLPRSTAAHADTMAGRLLDIVRRHDAVEMVMRGRGLIQGLELPDGESAGAVCAEAFRRGLLVETSGPEGEVVKLMPPLTIRADELERGLDIIAASVAAVVGSAVHHTMAKELG